MGISVSQPFAVISAMWAPARVSWCPRASTFAMYHLHIFWEGPGSMDSRLRATVCGLQLLSSAGEPACKRPSTHNGERVWMCARETWLAAEDPAWGRSAQPCLGACVQTITVPHCPQNGRPGLLPQRGRSLFAHVCASHLRANMAAALSGSLCPLSPCAPSPRPTSTYVLSVAALHFACPTIVCERTCSGRAFFSSGFLYSSDLL